jgi:hypothetical protein
MNRRHNRPLSFVLGSVVWIATVAGGRDALLPLYLADRGIGLTGIDILFSAQTVSGIAIQSQLHRISRFLSLPLSTSLFSHELRFLWPPSQFWSSFRLSSS